ncbi:MAG: single-stranded DNA-binding protein [Saprospiraceae bacterium]|jgi:single-strand DNA-binding protein|nr:single-stranded DNA-binding protein [Saprospiraceae bacterium]MDP4998637.1 single-stranded DNA-binding protein [Saprospiraceae bacterium]
MVNRVILIGNLGKDPEFRSLENGAALARFSLATSESYKDKGGNWQQQTEWHDIVVWRNLAERAQATLKKGMTVYVEGKLTHRTWQDQEGNTKRTTEVVANYFRVLDKKDTSATTGSFTPQDMGGHDTSGQDTYHDSDPGEPGEDLPF